MMNSSAISSTAPPLVPGNGPGRMVLVTAANRRAYDRDTDIPIGAGSDGFRGVEFRPARLANRQTAAWRGWSGEVIRICSQDAFQSAYSGPCHPLGLPTQPSRH